jgi:hypothetical protein
MVNIGSIVSFFIVSSRSLLCILCISKVLNSITNTLVNFSMLQRPHIHPKMEAVSLPIVL